MNRFSETYHILEILFMRYFFQWWVSEKDLPEEPQGHMHPLHSKQLACFLLWEVI